MKPDTSDVSGAKKALSLSIVTLAFCWLVFGKFLSGEVLFYHDSTQAFSLSHIFFQHLCNFKLALWSPELNSGQPVWPILEAFPLFDPVLLLVWCVGNLFGIGSVLLGETGVIAWLFAFSIGGLMLSRRLTRNWYINLAVFALLFGGPIAWGLPAQWSLLLPFRYAPFVLLAAINLIDNPNRRNAITFGIIFAISQCGYQLGYSLFYVLIFAGAYALSLRRQGRLPSFPATTAWIAAAVFLSGTLMLPAIIWKLRQMVALPRAYGYTWNFNPEAFFAGLFLPYYTTPYGKLDIGNTWHGSTMLGLPAAALLFVPVALFAAGLAQHQTPKEPKAPPLTNAWLAATAAGAVLCLGLFGLHKYFTEGGYFLFLRNWGYELTLVLLGMTQLAALGANQLQKQQAQGRNFLFAYGLIFLLAALYLLTRGPAISLSRTVLLFLLVPVPLFCGLFYWAGKTLSSRNFGILVFACVAGLLTLHIVKITPVKGHIIPPPFKLSPQKSEPKLPEYRDWLFPCERYAPFEMLGPAVVGHFSATMPNSINSPHALVIDLIQTRRYRNLIAGVQNEEAKKKILSVTAPILRTVAFVSFAASETEALEKLSAVRNPAELDNWAVVEGAGAASTEAAQAPRKAAARPDNKITLKHYEETKTVLEAEMAHDGLLIFADNWDADWKVYVDGEQAPLLIANLTNKAVFLHQGVHEVEFIYFPALYMFAFWSRMAFHLFAVIFAGLVVLRNRKSCTP